MAINMNYEKLLATVMGLYKVPTATVNTLQTAFVQSIALASIPIFIAYMLGVMPGLESLGFMTTVFSWALYLVAFLSAIPFATAVIRYQLGIPHQFALLDLSLQYIFIDYAKLIGLLLVFTFIAFLPYGVAEALQMSGSTSNLLGAFKYALLIAAIGVFLYATVKLMGSLVITTAGKSISLPEMFKKASGHFLSLTIIILGTILPIELITQIISYGLSGLTNATDLAFVDTIINVLLALIRSTALMFQLYFTWTGVTAYLKENKLL